MSDPQITNRVLMIRPAAFARNDETAASNHFQSKGPSAPDALAQRAQSEFDTLIDELRKAGVQVLSLPDTSVPIKPDAVFPNNWFSTHADGTVVFYPMLAPNRRLERRTDVLDVLRNAGFYIHRTVDLSTSESMGAYLEGTGSLVLDRVHRIAYACRSLRTSESALLVFANQLGYTPVVVDAFDAQRRPIYHTNVIMCVGRRFAAVCMDALDSKDADLLLRQFEASGHELIRLTQAQMSAFAGNMLELATPDGSCIAMSTSAASALTEQQIAKLERLAGPLVTASIPTIEHYGGGSVRCMLAEIHLPRESA
jgi:hypothetical protein